MTVSGGQEREANLLKSIQLTGKARIETQVSSYTCMMRVCVLVCVYTHTHTHTHRHTHMYTHTPVQEVNLVQRAKSIGLGIINT